MLASPGGVVVSWPVTFSPLPQKKIKFVMKMKSPKILLSIALVFVIATSSSCEAQSGNEAASPKGAASVAAEVAAVKPIAAGEAEKLMATQAELQILDVRTPEEVAQGVLKGARVINWFDGDFAERAEAGLDKSKPVLVYCKAGSRSAQAAAVLHEKGFATVYNLQGGITAWLGQGYPVQKQ